MRLRFLAKTVEHFACGGVNLTKGQSHDFSDELAARILKDYSQDFIADSSELPDSSDFRKTPKIRKPSLPKNNKAIKKCSTCKQL